MTFDELKRRVPSATPETWHQHPNGGGWVKNTTCIADTIFISSHAIVRGGEFRGGAFRGGEFYGGVFYGGEFRGGEFRGGEFWGGAFRGGEFYGGVFYGGEFRGGVWETNPIFIQGFKWFVCQSAPGRIDAGCESHTFEEWQRDWEALANKHALTPELRREYKAYIDLICKIGIPAVENRRAES